MACGGGDGSDRSTLQGWVLPGNRCSRWPASGSSSGLWRDWVRIQRRGGSAAVDPQQAADQLQTALFFGQQVVGVLHGLCAVLSPNPASVSMEAALPAAPAAVRLMLTTFQTYSKLQQLAGGDSAPAPVLLLGSDAIFQGGKSHSLSKVYWCIADITGAIQYDTADRSLLLLPGARELLRCPELVPCLAKAVLMTVLALDTGAGGTAESRDRDRSAAGSTSSSSRRNARGSSSSAAAGSSRDRQGFLQSYRTPVALQTAQLQGTARLAPAAAAAVGGWPMASAWTA
jgi:hypothetical protein